MVARTFEELDSWRLSDELKRAVMAISAINSSLRRRRHPLTSPRVLDTTSTTQFARHVRIAIASLDETRNHLLHGIDEKYWDTSAAEPLLQLAKRARGASVGLLKHLTTTEAPEKWPGATPRKRRRR